MTIAPSSRWLMIDTLPNRSAVLTLLILVISQVIAKTLGATHQKRLARAPLACLIRAVAIALAQVARLCEKLKRLPAVFGHQPAPAACQRASASVVVGRFSIQETMERRCSRCDRGSSARAECSQHE
jgi:Mg2+/Co2+ transporter CorB